MNPIKVFTLILNLNHEIYTIILYTVFLQPITSPVQNIFEKDDTFKKIIVFVRQIYHSNSSMAN